MRACSGNKLIVIKKKKPLTECPGRGFSVVITLRV